MTSMEPHGTAPEVELEIHERLRIAIVTLRGEHDITTQRRNSAEPPFDLSRVLVDQADRWRGMRFAVIGHLAGGPRWRCAVRSAIPSSTRRPQRTEVQASPSCSRCSSGDHPHAAAQVTEESVYAAPFLFADAVGTNVLPCFSGRLPLCRGAGGLTDAATMQSAVRLVSGGGQ